MFEVKGVNEIKNHPFFSSIDFNRLLRLELSPPFLPKSNETFEASSFEMEAMHHMDDGLLAQEDNNFQGFSYVREGFLKMTPTKEC